MEEKKKRENLYCKEFEDIWKWDRGISKTGIVEVVRFLVGFVLE